jgi:hypothetical protein
MMNVLTIFSSALFVGTLLVSCGEGVPLHGTIKASLGEKRYEAKVICVHLDEDRFKFNTKRVIEPDRADVRISGRQLHNRLALTIEDNGSRYSTKNLAEWSKDEDSAQGWGILYNEEIATQSHQASFEMTCLGPI